MKIVDYPHKLYIIQIRGEGYGYDSNK